VSLFSTDAKPNAMKACFQMAEARRRKTEGQLEVTIAALLKRQFSKAFPPSLVNSEMHASRRGQSAGTVDKNISRSEATLRLLTESRHT